MQAIVLTFDHLPLGLLGCYGNTWIETPHLDRLASQSFVFDNCYSDCLPVPDGNPPWWSGRMPSAAGAAPATHLIDGLRKSGVHTTLCVEADIVPESAGVFDEVRRVEGKDDADSPARDRPCAKLIADAVDCWQRQSDSPRPTLLWVASRGVPSPWLPPREVAGIYWEEFFDAATLSLAVAAATGDERPVGRETEPEQRLVGALERLASIGLLRRGAPPELEEFQALNRLVYASYVSAIDAWCGPLLDAVVDSSRDDVLLMVTAATGDVLSTHPCLEQGCPLIVDALVHVPLFVRRGAGEAVGSRCGELVSTGDLPATLAAWFHDPHATALDESRDLRTLLLCEPGAGRDELFFGADGIGWGVRTADFSCLCAAGSRPGAAGPVLGRPWLFSKPDDGHDLLDISDQNPEIARALALRIATRVGSDSGSSGEAAAVSAP